VEEGASLGNVLGNLEPKRPGVGDVGVFVLALFQDEIIERPALDVLGDNSARVGAKALERHDVGMLQAAAIKKHSELYSSLSLWGGWGVRVDLMIHTSCRNSS